jgi:hypothetical protein
MHAPNRRVVYTGGGILSRRHGMKQIFWSLLSPFNSIFSPPFAEKSLVFWASVRILSDPAFLEAAVAFQHSKP